MSTSVPEELQGNLCVTADTGALEFSHHELGVGCGVLDHQDPALPAHKLPYVILAVTGAIGSLGLCLLFTSSSLRWRPNLRGFYALRLVLAIGVCPTRIGEGLQIIGLLTVTLS
jgi:hypothetical protein